METTTKYKFIFICDTYVLKRVTEANLIYSTFILGVLHKCQHLTEWTNRTILGGGVGTKRLFHTLSTF